MRSQLTSFILTILLLTACSQPTIVPAGLTEQAPAISNGTTLAPDGSPAYTAAAQTIEAMLTEAAVPFVALDTAQPSRTPTPTEPPTETLPATSTPQPTRTPLPSDTPGPTSTPAPIVQAATPTLAGGPLPGLGAQPTWEDTFKAGGDGTAGGNWPLYNDRNLQMKITADGTGDSGGLALTALNANRRDPYDGWMVTDQSLKDFYLEARIKTGECRGLDRYGLLFRATADGKSGYLAGLSCDGQYSLRRWDQKLYMLLPWTSSPKIKAGPGQTNLLGVRADGDRLSLYVNGEYLNGIQDKSFSAGAFGPFAGAFWTDSFTVLFQRIAYWNLTGAAPAP